MQNSSFQLRETTNDGVSYYRVINNAVFSDRYIRTNYRIGDSAIICYAYRRDYYGIIKMIIYKIYYFFNFLECQNKILDARFKNCPPRCRKNYSGIKNKCICQLKL